MGRDEVDDLEHVKDVLAPLGVFFFFSSRRRHTRCSRDWSSDVCSSDLVVELRRRGLRAGQPQASKPKRHYKRVGGWLARFILGSIGFSPILTVMRLVL